MKSEEKEKVGFDRLPEVVNSISRDMKKLLEKQNDDELELLTRQQVMELLKVKAENTIINLEREGVLIPLRLGRMLRYRKSDIINLCDRNKGDRTIQ